MNGMKQNLFNGEKLSHLFFADGLDSAGLPNDITLSSSVITWTSNPGVMRTLTIPKGKTLKPMGFPIICKTLILDGTIDVSGGNGSNGGNASGQTGSSAGSAGTSGGNPRGWGGAVNGSASAGANGVTGTNMGLNAATPTQPSAIYNALLRKGQQAPYNTGTGGLVDPYEGGSGAGTGLEGDVYNIWSLNMHAIFGSMFTPETGGYVTSPNGGSGGGGSGASGGGTSGGGGGGGGAGGNAGSVWIFAESIITSDPSGERLIKAVGGNAGNGGNGGNASGSGASAGGGGGAGGLGGNGGVAMVICKSWDTAITVNVSGGNGGTKGTGGHGWSGSQIDDAEGKIGSDGRDGLAGYNGKFQLWRIG